MGLTIHDVPVERAALEGVVAVRTACCVDLWGNDDLAETVDWELASSRDRTYTRFEYLEARDAGRVVGAAVVELPQRDNTAAAYLTVLVLPDERRRGIGSALYEAAMDRARAAGRTVVIAGADQREEPPEGPGTLAPATGSGRVRLDAPGTRFALSRGWSLEQVERRSVLQLPADPETLARFRSEAAAASGPDYRLVTWDTDTPERWVDQYAYVLGRMSTDAPVGGLAWGAEAWDAARVRAREKELHDGGYRQLVLAAEHVPSGTIAAFTNFWVPERKDEYVHQGDTLVVPEHRGRRLGMLVKAANLQRLAAEVTSARRVGTWNAEENRWMLAINVALGFRPSGGAGQWQLRLA